MGDDEQKKGHVKLSAGICVFLDQKLSDHAEIYNGKQVLGNFGLEKAVVVKFSEVNDRNKREAKILSKVKHHNNVISLIEAGVYFGNIERYIYFAFDKFPRKNLRNFVECHAEIQFDRKLAILRQITYGVEYLHGENIAHLDLEPGKILYSHSQEKIIISDFGSSEELSEKEMFVEHQFGTNGFRPPESFGNSFVSLKTDIFSLGVVFCFVLSHGKNPLGEDPVDQNINTKNGKIDLSCLLVPNCETAKHLVKHMLEFKRKNRPKIYEVSDHPFWTGNEVEYDTDYETCSDSDTCNDEEEPSYDLGEVLSLSALWEKYAKEEGPIFEASSGTSSGAFTKVSEPDSRRRRRCSDGKENQQDVQEELQSKIAEGFPPHDPEVHTAVTPDSARRKISDDPSDIGHPAASQDKGREDVGKRAENSEERLSANAWLSWATQFTGDAPLRITEVLTQAHRNSEKFESDIERAFADVNRLQIKERDKIYLLHQFAHAYQSMRKPVQSVRAAKQAIELLDGSRSLDSNLKLLQLSLSCCATEACIDMWDLAHAVEHYHKVKDICGSIEESGPNHRTLASRVENLESRLDRFRLNDGQNARCIGRSGGVIELDDCAIYFPNGAVSSDILFHASIDFPVEVPPGKVLVTPVLRLNPNIRFKEPVQVKLTTWFASLVSDGVTICYRDTENSKWEEIEPKPKLKSGPEKIEFEIDRFCQYGCCVDEGDDGEFKIVSRLFSDPRRKTMTNHFVPKCKTLLDRDEEKRANRGLEPACETDPVLKVKKGDKIKISISDMIYPETKAEEPDMSSEIEIDDRFLKEFYHKPVNFLLSPKAPDLADITHTIEQYRKRDEIEKIVDKECHGRERIILRPTDDGFRTQVNVAQNIADRRGKIRSNSTNSSSSVNVNTKM